MTDPQVASDVRLIESLSKSVAIVLGFLYLLGFLVVANYLSRYGISSFSVLQLQYLIAGVWVLGPPAFYAVLLITARRFDLRAAPEVGGRFNWRRFAISALFTGIPSSMLLVLLFRIPNIESITWAMGIRLYLFYAAMLACAQLFWMSHRADSQTETGWINRNQGAPFYLASLVIIVVSYAVWFSVRLYPLIPFSMGGGRPLTVLFIEGEKKMPDEIAKSESSAKRSIPYKLLLSTENVYVVVSPLPTGKSLEIRRDTVAGMIVLD